MTPSSEHQGISQWEDLREFNLKSTDKKTSLVRSIEYQLRISIPAGKRSFTNLGWQNFGLVTKTCPAQSFMQETEPLPTCLTISPLNTNLVVYCERPKSFSPLLPYLWQKYNVGGLFLAATNYICDQLRSLWQTSLPH